MLSLPFLGCPNVVILPKVSAPAFSPASGTYTTDQLVSISTETTGATIYYTTNGDTPTESSNLYTNSISVSGDDTSVTIKAIAIKAGMELSAIETAQYTIKYPELLTNVQAVASGFDHTMILKTDGTLLATGGNYAGQLGDGTTVDRSVPVAVMSGVKAVSAGFEHTMILKNDGTLWATGNNQFGQLGDGTTTDRQTFVQISF